MLTSVSVLVPYRSDGGYREQAWEEVVGPAWGATGVEVIVESPGDGKHPGDFNHPRAINRAASRASGDVYLIADADTYWSPTLLPGRLVEAVREGAPWALPRHYAKLTQTQSSRLVKGSPHQSHEGLLDRAQWVGDSVSFSGLVCVPAATFRAVGGYDERWEFWGADDRAFGYAVDTLVGQHERVPGSCLHLWHPEPLTQTYGHSRHRHQYALGERYAEASGDPEAMRRVRFAEPRLSALA